MWYPREKHRGGGRRAAPPPGKGGSPCAILTRPTSARPLSYEEMMAAVEEAFLLFAQGRCAMADRSALTQGSTTLATMPCFAGGYAATKLLASCPDNPRRGSSLYGTVLLSQGDTGQPVALLEGNTLTALRTGAIGGLAAKHLAREDAATAGLVGCGVQGLHQLTFLCQVRPIRTASTCTTTARRTWGPSAGGWRPWWPQAACHRDLPRPGHPAGQKRHCGHRPPPPRPPLRRRPAPFRGKCLIAIGSWRRTCGEIPEAIWSATQEVFLELPLRLPGERRPVPAPGLRRSKTGGPALLRGLPSGQAGRRRAAPPPTPGISNPWAWRCLMPSPPGTSTWPPRQGLGQVLA